MESPEKMSSEFWKEIRALPMVQAVEDIYVSSKKSSSILNTGLAIIEYSLGGLTDRFYSHSSLAARVDSLAGMGVHKLKERYPTLHQSPKEIKHKTYCGVRSTVRSAMKTMPGRVLVGGLDWMIDKGDGLLKTVTPRDRSPRKRKMTRETLKKQHQQHSIKTEHTYASEDSGACDADSETKRAHKSQQTTAPEPSYESEDDMGMLMNMYMLSVVRPIKTVVWGMKTVRRYVAGKRRKSTMSYRMSPTKETEIERRRKLSPKKKVTSTFLGRLRQRTYRLLGYMPMKSISMDYSEDGGSCGDAERKRKHDEILTDEASCSEEDLENFDFDNYDSEEDPDYLPSDSEHSEDPESEEMDPESDLEAEIVGTGPYHIQLKKKGTPPKQPEGHISAKMDSTTETGPQKTQSPRPQGDVEV